MCLSARLRRRPPFAQPRLQQPDLRVQREVPAFHKSSSRHLKKMMPHLLSADFARYSRHRYTSAASRSGPFLRRPRCAGRRRREPVRVQPWRLGRRRSQCQHSGRRLGPHGYRPWQERNDKKPAAPGRAFYLIPANRGAVAKAGPRRRCYNERRPSARPHAAAW